MKKLFLITIVGAFALTSCKKDWTCECTAGALSVSNTIKDKSKKDAKKDCETSGNAGLVSYECKLK